MNVVLYQNFSKKENSTLQPSGSGTTFDCKLKDATGVLSPQLEFHFATGNPGSYNYAWINTFGRYYFIREWTYDKGVWIAQLEVDTLATWKSFIGAAELYVFRSSYAFNGNIIDTFYPAKAHVRTARHAITPIFNTDPNSLAPTFIIGLVVRNDVKYIGCTPVQLANFIKWLFSDGYFESVSNMASITPEIKVQINPMQYITKIHSIPARFVQSGSSSTSWGYLTYASGESVNSLKVGLGTIPFPEMNFSFYDFLGAYVKDMYLPITVSDIKHPQEDTRGRYLRAAPYTKWSLYLPPFGLIDLPSDEMLGASSITLHVTTDVRTGDARLEVIATNATTLAETVIVSTVSNVAIEHPITGVFTPGVNYMSIMGQMMSGAAQAYNNNYFGLVSAAINSISTYASGTVPHVSRIGSQGSGSQLSGNAELSTQFIEVVDDDQSGRGRPLCKKQTISGIPGYITADPDELSLPSTQSEMTTIREYIANGFFYE